MIDSLTFANMKVMRLHPITLIPFGLGAVSVLLPVFFGYPPMTGLWLVQSIPVIGSIGTSTFFDISVYIVVIGVVLTILFTIATSEK